MMESLSGVILLLIVVFRITEGFDGASARAESLLLALMTNGSITSDQLSQNTTTTNKLPPEIQSLHIHSQIRYRYSRTQVTTMVANVNDDAAQEISYQIVLPETAFISKFAMEIDGQSYEAYVKKKEEARDIYSSARNRGHSAALVEINARHSNVFDVNVNVRSQSEVTFYLKYEELLSRKLGRYQQAIHFSHTQVTKIRDFQVIVNIEESQNITMLKVPQVRNDVDAIQTADGNMKGVIIERWGKTASITWKPTEKDLQTLEMQGQTGKLIVEYDIARELDAGEVLVMNGYFVHFFAPEGLRLIKKHVVFVLDISGSMRGRKIEQLKDAMNKILADLKPADFFNIISFSSEVTHWTASDEMPVQATRRNIYHAQNYVRRLEAGGFTNIHEANIEALKLARMKMLPARVEPMILFLTDGEPTVGVKDLNGIKARIKNANKANPVPIYSLAFGSGADFTFLKQLSLQNNGIARKIYEASDASIQLTGFYNEISSPLLSNVTFSYSSPDFTVTNLTTTQFPTFLRGSEIIVSGTIISKIATDSEHNQRAERTQLYIDNHTKTPKNVPPESGNFVATDKINVVVSVTATGEGGSMVLGNPKIFAGLKHSSTARPAASEHRYGYNPFGMVFSASTSTDEDLFVEKLWAYLTIQQLLDRKLASIGQSDRESISSNTWGTSDALKLSLKYGFVTPLTSLVVVKPNQEAEIDVLSVANDEMVQSSSVSGDQRQPHGDKFVRSLEKQVLDPFQAADGEGNGHTTERQIIYDYKAKGGTALMSTPDYKKISLENFDPGDRTMRSSPVAELPTAWFSGNHWLRAAIPPSIDMLLQAAMTYGQPTVDSGPTRREPKFTLHSLGWFSYHNTSFRFNHLLVRIADEFEAENYPGGNSCQFRDREARLCQHLRDCIKREFLFNFELYKSHYFCEIYPSSLGSGFVYAGVCCPNGTVN